jgi:hypothetical protein
MKDTKGNDIMKQGESKNVIGKAQEDVVRA